MKIEISLTVRKFRVPRVLERRSAMSTLSAKPEPIRPKRAAHPRNPAIRLA